MEVMECDDLPLTHDPDNKYGTLGHFEIEKKIGKGQFSEVYRAKCKSDASVVALKKVQVVFVGAYQSLSQSCMHLFHF